jgi:aspartate/methionine/tyrosine aminotransferase
MGVNAGRFLLVLFCLECQQSLQIKNCKPRSIFRLNVAGECELATEGTLPCDLVVKVAKSQKSVWTVFGEIAAKTDASNLGQGFPDWDPPAFLLDALREAVDSKFHQYTRPAGHPPLVKLIADKYSKHLDREVDPSNEVAVTVGASQALYLALTLFLKANEEVVLFEPFFDLYGKQIKLTGGIPKYVSLGGRCATAADPWALDIESLRR